MQTILEVKNNFNHERHYMNNNSLSHDTSSQFALSYELLHLLQWLAIHDADKLKRIITKAIEQGLYEEIQKAEMAPNSELLQDMHHSTIDFFGMLDEMLCDAINEHVKQKARNSDLLATIDQIDSAICDTETVRSSMVKTAKKLDTYPHVNPKEQLFEEILKKWKPFDRNSMN
jgi:hypothetical protein